MAAYPYILLVLLPATLSSIFFCDMPLTLALNAGFSVELIHRDSPKSPLYNPTQTPFHKVSNALRRSFNRVNHFYPQAKVSPDAVQSEITSNGGEYLMKYSIGTPPLEIMGIADTGSDIIWTQCIPCDHCFNQTAPMFDPSVSNTYHNIPCFSGLCQSLEDTSCSSTGRESVCQYRIQYGDRSYSQGDLSTDTITLGSSSDNPVSFPNIRVGCGHNNHGTFHSETSGIVGLGGGVVSLTSQIGTEIDFKFSYCLVPFFESQNISKLNFGENAVVSGSGTVSTPIIPGSPSTFYYLTLEAMSVGAKRLEFVGDQPTSTNGEGNIIIDSGTTLTFLPVDFYRKLESEVAEFINLERVQDPLQMLNLCYESPWIPSNTIDAPIMTAHFTGADIQLSPQNTFVRVSNDVVCFAFNPVSGGGIFGNIAQMNFLVGYDIQKKIVSFKPTDCTKK